MDYIEAIQCRMEEHERLMEEWADHDLEDDYVDFRLKEEREEAVEAAGDPEDD